MSRFLLDANLSPETRRFLVHRFGFDVDDLPGRGKADLPDAAVAALAVQEHRVVITLERGFGEIYYRWEQGRFGVIVLRLADQTVESVNRTLEHLFVTEAPSIDLDRSLVIIEAERLRIVHG